MGDGDGRGDGRGDRKEMMRRGNGIALRSGLLIECVVCMYC